MKVEKIIFTCTSVMCAILLIIAIKDENYKQVLPLVLLLISQLGLLFFNKTNQ